MTEHLPPNKTPVMSSIASGSSNWFTLVAISFLLTVSFLDLGNYFSAIDPDFQPKKVYGLLLAIALVSIGLTNRRSEMQLRSVFVGALLAYSCFNLLHAWLLPWPSVSNGKEIAMFRAQIPPIAVVIAFAAMTLPRLILARVFAGILVIICLSVLLDFAFPQVLYPVDAPASVPGRAAGLLVNPTKAGEVVILTFLLALPALTPHRALILLLLAGVAVLLTFSRGSMLIWMLLFSLLCLIGNLPRGSLLALAGALTALTASIGLLTLYISQGNSAADITGLIERLGFFSGDQLTDDSAATRSQVLFEGLKMFAAHPMFGAGAGASLGWQLEVGPHNQPIMMSADYGVLGLVGWVTFVVLCIIGRYFRDFRLQWLATGVVFLFSMLTHNMLDFTYWMIALLLLSTHLRGQGAYYPPPR